MIRDGYPAKNITIVADPEAFGNMSFGSDNASEIDRKVTISTRGSPSLEPREARRSGAHGRILVEKVSPLRAFGATVETDGF